MIPKSACTGNILYVQSAAIMGHDNQAALSPVDSVSAQRKLAGWVCHGFCRALVPVAPKGARPANSPWSLA